MVKGGETSAVTAKPVAQASPRTELDDDVYEWATKPRSHAMNEIDKFVSLFLAAAEANKKTNGYVGKGILAKICRSCGMTKTEPARLLMRNGWLVGEFPEGGQKISRYRAGPKMPAYNIQTASAPQEGSFEYAEWRAAQKTAMLAKKAELEKEMGERIAGIDAELADIALAERAVEQIRALRPPSKT